jgi:hypothetical protein
MPIKKNNIQIANGLFTAKDQTTTFNRIRDLRNYINSNPHCYEITGSEVNEYVKPYFDIDIKDTEPDFNLHNNHRVKFLSDIKDLIAKKFNVSLDSLAVSETKRPNKISYHIILYTHKIKYDILKKFMDLHKDDFKALHVDYSVYGKYKKFRLIRCSKEADKIKNKPLNHKRYFSRHLITFFKTDLPELTPDIPEPREEPKKENIPSTKGEPLTTFEFCSYDRLERICNGLKLSRLDEYTSWRDIALSICNVSTQNNYVDDGTALVLILSKKSEKFNQNSFNTFMNQSYKCTNGFGLGFLLKMLKEDNYEQFLLCTLPYDKSYKKVKEVHETTDFKSKYPNFYGTYYNNEIRMYRKGDYMNLYENKYYYAIGKDRRTKEEKVCKVSFIEKWFKDETIRTYDRLDFYPDTSKCPKEVYNLFSGFEINKQPNTYDYDESKIKIILDHIRLLSGSNDDNYNYFLKWIAQIFQKPGELSRVAVVLYSKQGVGKGLLVKFLSNVIGDKYVYSSADADDLLGKNAEGLRNRLLVNLDEASGKDTFIESNKIKSLITEPKITYHKKFFQPVQINNFSRFLFTTNNDTSVKVELSDRRFVVFESDNTYRSNPEYFEPLVKAIESKEVQHIFYQYITNLDINDYNFETNRPKTKIYNEMKKINIPKPILFIISLINTDKLKEEYRAQALFNDYQAFLYNSGYTEYKTNITKFGRALNKITSGVTKRKLNGRVKICIDKQELLNYLEQDYGYNETDYLF